MSGSTHQSSVVSNEITQEAQENNGVSLRMAAASPQDTGTSNPRDSNNQKALIKLVSEDLKFVVEASMNIMTFGTDFCSKLETASQELNKLIKLDSSDEPLHDEVHDLMKRVRKLKLQIPLKVMVNSNDRGGHKDIRSEVSSRGKQVHNQNIELSQIAAVLFADAKFKLTSASKDFLLIFDGLDINLKLCLLCFSLFPENVIIRKRLMINWWLGEGFISGDEHGTEFFDELIQQGFIVPAHKKRTLRVNSCKMHPFVRCALILLAKEAKIFDFDPNAIPKDEYSSSIWACLTGNGLVNTENLHNVHILFNLNEDILDFKPELFSKMKNVNVLYLGRWQASAKHHVEVDDSKILEGLKVMKHLKFLSLQGISGIKALPASVSKLRSLTVLDLRACHNLEAIPEEIGSLESLTRLDMSECYLLSRMPKELTLLKSLLVLKGFIVGVSYEDKTLCNLEDLAKLPKLRKLGIYTNKENFPDEQDLIDFSKFEYLTNLLITWGSNNTKNAEKSMVKAPGLPSGIERANAPGLPSGRLPSGIEKLDLRRYPGKFSPHWLNPNNLQSLKKLYIRGGQICVLSQCQEWKDEEFQRGSKWEVELLRMKYLSELRMDWREVKNMFPKLMYLEKLRCPKLTLFPCDIFGVWIDSTKAQGNCNKWHPEIAE